MAFYDLVLARSDAPAEAAVPDQAFNHPRFSGLDTGAVFDQHGNQIDPAFGE
jgi:hypothetical protein